MSDVALKKTPKINVIPLMMQNVAKMPPKIPNKCLPEIPRMLHISPIDIRPFFPPMKRITPCAIINAPTIILTMSLPTASLFLTKPTHIREIILPKISRKMILDC